jgi:hypothetical protein
MEVKVIAKAMVAMVAGINGVNNGFISHRTDQFYFLIVKTFGEHYLNQQHSFIAY